MLQFIARINDRYSVAELAQMAIEGGCHWVELDLPDASDDFVRETALELKNLCMETGTFLTIVDRPEVAKEAGLHGVQLRGANARRAAEVREELGAEAIIGIEAAGADAVSLTNTFLGMAVDVERMKPVLSTVTGGLSGPCIRPIAVRMVWQVAKAVSIPVVGLGGIMNGHDALEFLMAGATAVQLGTANFIDPCASVKTLEEIEDFCSRHGVKDIHEIIGIL